MYETFKLVHIIAAIVWLGAGTLFTILNLRLARAKDHAAAAIVGEHGAALGGLLFMPASIVTLLAGVAMVITTDSIQFRDAWIIVGLVGVFVSAVIGSTVGRMSERIKPLAEAGDTAGIGAVQRRMQTLGSVDLVLLYAVVAVMVYKPGA